jgi:hypothetical protein
MRNYDDMNLNSGFFSSEAIHLMQRVFKGILSKEWFDRTHENEQALAKFLVRCLQSGLKEEDNLRLVGENAALIKWSKSQDMIAWPIKSSLADNDEDAASL